MAPGTGGMRVTLTERSVLAARLTESSVLAVTLTASGASPARSNAFPQHQEPFSSLESRPCTPLARHLTRSVPLEVLASTPQRSLSSRTVPRHTRSSSTRVPEPMAPSDSCDIATGNPWSPTMPYRYPTTRSSSSPRCSRVARPSPGGGNPGFRRSCDGRSSSRPFRRMRGLHWWPPAASAVLSHSARLRPTSPRRWKPSRHAPPPRDIWPRPPDHSIARPREAFDTRSDAAGAMSPDCVATATRSRRLRNPRRSITRCLYVSTVLTEMLSRSAMS